MTEIKVTCDRCKCVIIESRTILKVESGVMRSRDGVEAVDLCRDCGSCLSDFLRAGADAFALSTPEPTTYT